MINQIDDKLPIFGVTTIEEQVQESMNQDRLIAQLVSFFGALALILACIGLYGVMAHGVARRTNEIGIRMALGAQGRQHRVDGFARNARVGRDRVGDRRAGSIAVAARLISTQLFGFSPTDPAALIGAAVVLTVVALLAGYVPARRASRVESINCA